MLLVGSEWGSYAALVSGSGARAGGSVARTALREAAEEAGEKLARQGAKQAARGAGEEATRLLPRKAYHYTREEVAPLIEQHGLKSKTGIVYATPHGNLSPLQAQIDLALPPNRGLPTAVFEVDIAGLRKAGYKIIGPRLVGRAYNMPGGGQEILIYLEPFPDIPPQYLRRIR